MPVGSVDEQGREAALRHARDALFRDRVRVYSLMVAGVGAVFLVLGIVWQEPALALRIAFKSGVVLGAGAIWGLARGGAPIGVVRAASVALFGAFFTAMAAVGIAAGEPHAQTLLIAGTTLGLAGALPWGAGLQAFVGGIGTAAWYVMERQTEGVSPFAAAIFLTFTWLSPVLAWTLDAQWRKQWRRQDDARLRAAQESGLARTLATAGANLFEHLHQTDLMTRACRITCEALHADFVVTLVAANDGESLDATFQYGLDDEAWAAYGAVRVPGAIAAVIRDHLEPDGRYLLDVDEIAGLPVEAVERREIARRLGLGPILLVSLHSSGAFTGVVAACRRLPATRFGDAELRTADGLAPLIAASLENQRLVRELSAANRIQHELLAGMSHELRTPLNVILGYLEMLLDGVAGPLNERQKAFCERVRDSAAQQLALVGEALELSRRDDSGRIPIRREPIDPAAFLSELVSEFRVKEHDGRVDIVGEVAAGLPILLADSIKLRMILRNLVENALRHTPKGEVRICVSLEEGTLCLEVRDTGVGIPEAERERVFDAFLQGTGGSSNGLGLGLHIVRRLVEALDGTVTLDSREGAGARFTVRIPVEPCPPRASAGGAPAAA